MKVKIIKAWCADENVASSKALERNGFERKNVIESAINVCGEKYDFHMKVERYISNDEIPETDKKFIKE